MDGCEGLKILVQFRVNLCENEEACVVLGRWKSRRQRRNPSFLAVEQCADAILGIVATMMDKPLFSVEAGYYSLSNICS